MQVIKQTALLGVTIFCDFRGIPGMIPPRIKKSGQDRGDCTDWTTMCFGYLEIGPRGGPTAEEAGGSRPLALKKIEEAEH